MGKYKTLGQNTLYSFIGAFGTKMIGFLMLPFYTKWLSPSDYGTTDLITVYASLLTSAVTLSMHEAIFVFPLNQKFQKQKEYFSTALASSVGSIIITLLVFFLLSLIGGYLAWKGAFFDNIWSIAFLFSTSYLQTLSQQFCRAIDRMKVFCLSSLLYAACTAIFALLLIPYFGLFGFIWSVGLSNIVAFLYSAFGVKVYKYISVRAVLVIRWMEMAKYAIPLIPNATIWWIISSLNRPFMEKYLGLSAIGIFAVANKFPTVVSAVLGIFSNSWQISVLQEYGNKTFKEFYSRISLIYIPLLVLVSCLLALISEWLIMSFIDEKFYEAWKYVPIISLAIVGMGLGGFVGGIFAAVKKSKYYLYSSIFGGVATLVFNILLIPYFGLWGAAVSFSLSHFAICLVRVYYSSKFIKNDKIGIITFYFLMNIILAVLVINKHILLSWVIFTILVSLFCYLNKSVIIESYNKIKLCSKN